MSKYIIEADERSELIQVISVMPNGTVYTNEKSIDELEELNSDYINEHFGELQDEAYQKGLEEGKGKSEDGCTGCKYEGKVVTGPPCISCCNSYKNQWTAKDDKIEVGDEVTHKSDSVKWTAVVTRISCGTLTLMGNSGAIADNYPIEDFVKTGRHFDIAKILEAMKND